MTTTMNQTTQATDPRLALLQELLAKIPDPVPDANAYGWAKLELLGHRVLYGYLDQVEFGQSRVLRIRQPAAADKGQGAGGDALQLVEVGRYSVAAMYGCTPLTKAQAVANLDWVRDQMAELWHATRALPARSSSPADPDDFGRDPDDEDAGGDEDQGCPHCLAPAGQSCAPECRDDDVNRPMAVAAPAVQAPTSSHGDLP